MPIQRTYRVRYSLEEWNKPPEGTFTWIAPGIAAVEDDHGYADEVLVASVLMKEGKLLSILLIDSVSQSGNPPRWLLEAVRDQINHQLEFHTPPTNQENRHELQHLPGTRRRSETDGHSQDEQCRG